MKLYPALFLLVVLFPGVVFSKEVGGDLLIPYFPVYPEEAVAHQVEGEVTIEFDVSRMGTPENIQVVSSTKEIFVKPCVKAVSKLKFKPKLIDGAIVGVKGYKVKYKFRFNIKELYYSVHLVTVSEGDSV